MPILPHVLFAILSLLFGPTQPAPTAVPNPIIVVASEKATYVENPAYDEKCRKSMFCNEPQFIVAEVEIHLLAVQDGEMRADEVLDKGKIQLSAVTGDRVAVLTAPNSIAIWQYAYDGQSFSFTLINEVSTEEGLIGRVELEQGVAVVMHVQQDAVGNIPYAIGSINLETGEYSERIVTFPEEAMCQVPVTVQQQWSEYFLSCSNLPDIYTGWGPGDEIDPTTGRNISKYVLLTPEVAVQLPYNAKFIAQLSSSS